MLHVISGLWGCSTCTSPPSAHSLMRYLAITAVKHSCGGILPHIGYCVVPDTETEPGKLLVEGFQPVIKCPESLASFCSCEHVLVSSLGYGIP